MRYPYRDGRAGGTGPAILLPPNISRGRERRASSTNLNVRDKTDTAMHFHYDDFQCIFIHSFVPVWRSRLWYRRMSPGSYYRPELLQEAASSRSSTGRGPVASSQPHTRGSRQTNRGCTGAGQGSRPRFSRACNQGHQRCDAREALNPAGLIPPALPDSILVFPKREARRVFSTAPARAGVSLCTSIVLRSGPQRRAAPPIRPVHRPRRSML
jgi:hypothetical protein